MCLWEEVGCQVFYSGSESAPVVGFCEESSGQVWFITRGNFWSGLRTVTVLRMALLRGVS